MKFDEKSKIDNSIRNHPKSFQSNTHYLDEVQINLGLIRNLFRLITNLLRDSSKTENFCRAGPVKFNKKSKIDNSIRNHPKSFQSNTHHLLEVQINLGLIRNLFRLITNLFRDSSKTENFCRSGPVKFDEKSKIDNSI